MSIEIVNDYIKRVEKLWGTEYWVVNNESYCMKFLFVIPGRCSSLHYHKIKDETFYMERGVVFIEIGGEVMELRQGQSVRLKPGQRHKFWNEKGSEEATIVEVSTRHADEDVVRLEESKIL